MSQLYIAYRIIVYKSFMKKSEKIKGKEGVAARKKKQVQNGIIAGGWIKNLDAQQEFFSRHFVLPHTCDNS